jgi:hypothetical protein
MNEKLAHVADVEEAGILAGPKMLRDDAFVLDRHFVTSEGNHPGASSAMPRIERQRVERLRRGTRAAFGITAIGRSPRLGIVGWT